MKALPVYFTFIVIILFTFTGCTREKIYPDPLVVPDCLNAKFEYFKENDPHAKGIYAIPTVSGYLYLFATGESYSDGTEDIYNIKCELECILCGHCWGSVPCIKDTPASEYVTIWEK